MNAVATYLEKALAATTLEALAAKTEIEIVHLTQIAAGEVSMMAIEAKKIAEHLGLDPFKLLEAQSTDQLTELGVTPPEKETITSSAAANIVSPIVTQPSQTSMHMAGEISGSSAAEL